MQHEVLSQPPQRFTPHMIMARGALQKQLQKVLDASVAYEREESTVELLCVAAPVLEPDGRISIAAISVTDPVGRFDP